MLRLPAEAHPLTPNKLYVPISWPIVQHDNVLV